MPYRMAGIDVHKKRLAIVVADAEAEDHYQFADTCSSRPFWEVPHAPLSIQTSRPEPVI